MILNLLHNSSKIGETKLNDTNESEKGLQKNYIMEAHHSIPKDMVIDCRVAKEGNSYSVEFHMIIGGRPFLAKSYVQVEEITDDEIVDELSNFLYEVIHDLLDRYGFKFTMKEIETHDKIVRLTPQSVSTLGRSV